MYGGTLEGVMTLSATTHYWYSGFVNPGETGTATHGTIGTITVAAGGTSVYMDPGMTYNFDLNTPTNSDLILFATNSSGLAYVPMAGGTFNFYAGGSFARGPTR